MVSLIGAAFLLALLAAALAAAVSLGALQRRRQRREVALVHRRLNRNNGGPAAVLTLFYRLRRLRLDDFRHLIVHAHSLAEDTALATLAGDAQRELDLMAIGHHVASSSVVLVLERLQQLTTHDLVRISAAAGLLDCEGAFSAAYAARAAREPGDLVHTATARLYKEVLLHAVAEAQTQQFRLAGSPDPFARLSLSPRARA